MCMCFYFFIIFYVCKEYFFTHREITLTFINSDTCVLGKIDCDYSILVKHTSLLNYMKISLMKIELFCTYK